MRERMKNNIPARRLRENNNQQMKLILDQIKKLREENSQYKDQLAIVEDKVRMLQGDVNRCKGYASEAVWSAIFNNVISGSRWLQNTSFSAGRWAVGYQYLYVMYRVLNEIHPKRILELGLGQSMRMLGQYAAVHEKVSHFVVEHDPEWIDFFQRDFQLSARSRIIQLERKMEPYKEASAVRVFKGFKI